MNLLIIDAGKTESAYWSDLWRYRELFFFLSWRDILVRYKRTVIGILWAVIKPLVTMIVLTLVFSRIAHVKSDGLPYPVMILAGMVPWLFFSSSLAEASSSLVTNANMLSKIYFPRIIMPASSVIVTFVDFLISGVLLAVVMACYGVFPSWQIVALPLFTLVGLIASLGMGLWLAALNVKFRDFRYVLPFIVQFGLYLSPVGFPGELARQRFGVIAYAIYSLNPMVGVINGFRWAIGGRYDVPMDWLSLLMSVLMAGLITISGLRYFRATEETFADII